jgi:hypothetical protein
MKRVSSLATILVCTLGFATFSSAQTTAKEAMEEKKPILKKENSEKPSAAQKLPEGYPSQSELSPEDFESQKQVWIQNNPDEYQNMIPQKESKPDVSSLPGFPVFVDTGNPSLDHEEYQRKKKAWYDNNQELIKEFNNSLNTNTNEK